MIKISEEELNGLAIDELIVDELIKQGYEDVVDEALEIAMEKEAGKTSSTRQLGQRIWTTVKGNNPASKQYWSRASGNVRQAVSGKKKVPGFLGIGTKTKNLTAKQRIARGLTGTGQMAAPAAGVGAAGYGGVQVYKRSANNR